MWIIPLRRRFFSRIPCLCIVVFLLLYTSLTLFGDLKTPKLFQLTDLSTCPACYGNSLCHELYSGEIALESNGYLSRYFNAKNIYHGFVVKTKQKVLLKKLAHDWELQKFDKHLCEVLKRMNNLKSCKPSDVMHLDHVDKIILSLVQYNLTWPALEPRKGVILCPFTDRINDLLEPFMQNKLSDTKTKMLNILTLLSINPEPLILQLIPKSKGWPVPGYGGLCGRLEVVGHEGEPLSTLKDIHWKKKLVYAKKIIESAMDFTFKHEKFRFYLMDWSLDNIVANEKDNITFVDLEDIIVLDKHIKPNKQVPNWYQRYSRDILGGGFIFSIERICQHHLSDHNIWAACYVLAGDDNPWLYPIPGKINKSRPHLDVLLYECLNGEDRFKTVAQLQLVFEEMLSDANLFRDLSEI